MRTTSIETYRKIKEEGLLGDLQLRVYGALFQFGPATQQEIWLKAFPNTQARNITPRFAELEAMGLITMVNKRPDQITGRTCIEWDVTDSMPSEVIRTETLTQKVKRLEKENAELKVKLFNVTNGELMLS